MKTSKSEDSDPHPEKTSQQTVLLVNTGSVKKRFILQRISNLPYKIVVLNAEKNWAEPYVDDWIIADTNNQDLAINAVQEYQKTHPIDGVLTFWEDDVLLTAKLVDLLGLTGTSYEVAQRVRNKYNFRTFCQENKLPVPKFIKISDDNLGEVSNQLHFPVVIKPALGASSAYVIKVEDESELKKTVQYIKKNASIEVESALTNGSTLMVEEYIDGDEVDIDILLQNGKIKFWAINDNYQTKEPFFTETGTASPTNLPESDQFELLKMAEMVLEKIGVTNGCIHFEAKYSSQGPVPIEVNLRMGGDEVYYCSKYVWEVDLIEYAVKICLGVYFAPIEKPDEPYTYLAAYSFTPDESGVLASLEVPDEFPEECRVQQFHFYHEVGDALLAPPGGYDFLGWITTFGDNHNDAADNLEKAKENINYEIVPFSEFSSLGKTKRRSPLSAAIIESTQFKQGEKITRLRALELSQQRKLIIGIAYNSNLGESNQKGKPVGLLIQAALEEKGYKIILVDFNSLSNAFTLLQTGKIDLVFNVVDQIHGSSLLSPNVAAICDVLKIPYTGSNPLTLGLCADKIKVKKLLNYHNIPTAKWDYMYDLQDKIDPDLEYPLIVKPANTDNFFGITQKSVVENETELNKQLKYILQELKRPALIEEYLGGDEFIVSIMGNDSTNLQVLPLTRLIFDVMTADLWHINPFGFVPDLKKLDSSQPIVQHPAKNVSSKLSALISEIALDTYKILDNHDYGRVEIKLDMYDNPHVLELNPNPPLHSESYMAEAAGVLDIEYADFLEQIIALTIQRYKDQPPYYHLQSFSL